MVSLRSSEKAGVAERSEQKGSCGESRKGQATGELVGCGPEFGFDLESRESEESSVLPGSVWDVLGVAHECLGATRELSRWERCPLPDHYILPKI